MDDLISILSEIRSQYNCFDPKEEPYYRALSEAIGLISAQKTQLSEEDATKGTTFDYISRQAAIDAMEESKTIYHDRKVVIGKMQDIVNNLPSAQRWIPVNERLPDEGLVLVACGKDGDAFYVAPADFARESAYEGYVKAWMQIEPWKGGRR